MEKLKDELLAFNRKTITLKELEEISPNKESYEQFATEVIGLENADVLQMIQSKGRNGKTPSLAYHYRIRKHPLKETYYQELQKYRLQFHNSINLDAYFKLDAKKWKQDLPYLEKINAYIEQYGFPNDKVPAPERSFELVGDEKWIEQKGEKVLQLIKLWEDFQIMPVADPLMFAINPRKITNQTAYHLIVENKTTYQALLPVFLKSTFATLIYGSGNKIIKSIENFTTQYPTESTNYFFYFGDIDYSGVTIWHLLNEKQQVTPALAFYQACLAGKEAYGKTNQTKNVQALQSFLTHFSQNHQEQIKQLLANGAYYPQEILKTKQLQEILLTTNWKISFE